MLLLKRTLALLPRYIKLPSYYENVYHFQNLTVSWRTKLEGHISFSYAQSEFIRNHIVRTAMKHISKLCTNSRRINTIYVLQ